MEDLQPSQGRSAELRKPLAVFAYLTDLVEKQIAAALNSEHVASACAGTQRTAPIEAKAGG